MFSISNEEQKKLPPLGDEITCDFCHEVHKVLHTEAETSEFVMSTYKCGDSHILAGVNGKDVRSKLKPRTS